MQLFDPTLLPVGLLMLASADAFPSAQLAKRGVTYDTSCDIKYGSLTAKQYVEKGIDFMPSLAKAGQDGVNNVMQTFRWRTNETGWTRPNVTTDDFNRISASYRIIFGNLIVGGNPNFVEETKHHIDRLQLVSESLNRAAAYSGSRRPDLIVHCSDDWLKTSEPDKEHKYFPKEPTLPEGYEWFITFCKALFETQAQLQLDSQPQIWDLNPKKSTRTSKNYADNKVDQFHMPTFSRKIGFAFFHQFMHAHLFNSNTNEFKEQEFAGGQEDKVYGFDGVVGLVGVLVGAKDVAKSARNIENIWYWCLAVYFDEYKWHLGYPAPKITAKMTTATPAPTSTPGNRPHTMTAAENKTTQTPSLAVRGLSTLCTSKHEPSRTAGANAPVITDEPNRIDIGDMKAAEISSLASSIDVLQKAGWGEPRETHSSRASTIIVSSTGASATGA
ncbi:hypothetical protein K469DRAFT_796750 [Zopfia rhizophila CBS 207.26]|uniref:Uncharacterized protein n=1 Tax=Zopfia rhizophila CBS 207.26 TaxID=1314779 RepID=A0A6A6DP65_9PEZI|nr:hypothetical protein K469DRAFT_796750 [Zopfia rhizophila CBS 207.26]